MVNLRPLGLTPTDFSYHDQQLFKVAESHRFEATPEQMTLLNFRVVARRVFGRHIALRHAPRMLEYDRGLPPQVQREWFAIHNREIVEAEQSLRNVTYLKSDYDQRVMARDFNATNAYVAYFAGPPEFLCADLVDVDHDFAARSIQGLAPPAHLCAYNLAVENGWAFVFSWIGTNTAAEQLAKSFDSRLDNEKASAVLCYAVEYTDSLFFAPRWWGSLSTSEAAAVVNALTARLHPHYVRSPDVLTRAFVPVSSVFVRSTKIGPWSAAA
jgi:hypothetical protein